MNGSSSSTRIHRTFAPAPMSRRRKMSTTPKSQHASQASSTIQSAIVPGS
jgi:hypothetical protein